MKPTKSEEQDFQRKMNAGIEGIKRLSRELELTPSDLMALMPNCLACLIAELGEPKNDQFNVNVALLALRACLDNRRVEGNKPNLPFQDPNKQRQRH